MSLYAKLVGTDPTKRVAVHNFMAAIAERHRGILTRDDIILMFNLEVADHLELDEILDKSDALAADRRFEFSRMIHDILLLSESGLAFTTSEDFYSRIEAFT